MGPSAATESVQARGPVVTGTDRGQIVDAVSIAERPARVEDRAVPGHWEGDLLSGARNTHIATLVERTSRYVQLVRGSGKDTTTVVSALIRAVQRLPDGLMARLTWDRGLEMAQHARFSIATDVAVYCCDPQSPWHRGTNENTNGLLRQYGPDGTDRSRITQRQLDAVARALNTRPRKTLQFRTPAAILAEAVAMFELTREISWRENSSSAPSTTDPHNASLPESSLPESSRPESSLPESSRYESSRYESSRYDWRSVAAFFVLAASFLISVVGWNTFKREPPGVASLDDLDNVVLAWGELQSELADYQPIRNAGEYDPETTLAFLDAVDEDGVPEWLVLATSDRLDGGLDSKERRGLLQ